MFGATATLIPSPLVAAPVALALLLPPAANAALLAVMLRSVPEEMRTARPILPRQVKAVPALPGGSHAIGARWARLLSWTGKPSRPGG